MLPTPQWPVLTSHPHPHTCASSLGHPILTDNPPSPNPAELVDVAAFMEECWPVLIPHSVRPSTFGLSPGWTPEHSRERPRPTPRPGRNQGAGSRGALGETLRRRCSTTVWAKLRETREPWKTTVEQKGQRENRYWSPRRVAAAVGVAGKLCGFWERQSQSAMLQAGGSQGNKGPLPHSSLAPPSCWCSPWEVSLLGGARRTREDTREDASAGGNGKHLPHSPFFIPNSQYVSKCIHFL